MHRINGTYAYLDTIGSNHENKLSPRYIYVYTYNVSSSIYPLELSCTPL